MIHTNVFQKYYIKGVISKILDRQFKIDINFYIICQNLDII
jgi:hypothetical protein